MNLSDIEVISWVSFSIENSSSSSIRVAIVILGSINGYLPVASKFNCLALVLFRVIVIFNPMIPQQLASNQQQILLLD
jgi:hypothetical protein